MLTTCLGRRYLWGVVSLWLTAGVTLWGCALHEPPPPQPPPVDISRRLGAMEACVARAQEAVDAALATGVSAAALAPATRSIADLQEALDAATKLAQQGKQQDAAAWVTQGLEGCEKIAAMVAQTRQDAAERKVRAQWASEAETRMAWTVACVDGARQAIGKASVARLKTAELTGALSALNRAETALQQGRTLLTQSDPKGAVERLEIAQADCQTAYDTADKAAAAKRQSAAPAARPRRR